LQQNGRPFLIINATNLESGARSGFTQLYFDAMGSVLESYPIARAVVASSAFPILLSPISLMNC
jgi:NTE family protein